MQPDLLSYLFCQRQQLFFRFPSKHLSHIVHGLCFSWVNDSSIRYIHVLRSCFGYIHAYRPCFSSWLMRCIFQVDRLISQVDNNFVHWNDSFDSSTFGCVPLSELMRFIIPLDSSFCQLDTTCPHERVVKRIFRLVSSGQYWT